MANHKNLTLLELLNLANESYPDGFLGEYFDPQTAERRVGGGDTLAQFIVAELSETFDAGASRAKQLREARIALENATEKIDEVIYGLCQQA
jgi:hypothetical protein